MVSFDGEWVYYSHLYNLQKANQWSPPRQGADIFKIHVRSRRIVKLTASSDTTPPAAVSDLATGAERPAYAKVEKKDGGGGREQLRAYLGTIPDYAQEVAGVKLSGTRGGSNWA